MKMLDFKKVTEIRLFTDGVCQDGRSETEEQGTKLEQVVQEKEDRVDIKESTWEREESNVNRELKGGGRAET